MLPPKFEHFAADVSQSNESCTRELRAYPRITFTATFRYIVIRNTNHVLLESPESDCLCITNSGLPN